MLVASRFILGLEAGVEMNIQVYPHMKRHIINEGIVVNKGHVTFGLGPGPPGLIWQAQITSPAVAPSVAVVQGRQGFPGRGQGLPLKDTAWMVVEGHPASPQWLHAP